MFGKNAKRRRAIARLGEEFHENPRLSIALACGMLADEDRQLTPDDRKSIISLLEFGAEFDQSCVAVELARVFSTQSGGRTTTSLSNEDQARCLEIARRAIERGFKDSGLYLAGCMLMSVSNVTVQDELAGFLTTGAKTMPTRVARAAGDILLPGTALTSANRERIFEALQIAAAGDAETSLSSLKRIFLLQAFATREEILKARGVLETAFTVSTDKAISAAAALLANGIYYTPETREPLISFIEKSAYGNGKVVLDALKYIGESNKSLTTGERKRLSSLQERIFKYDYASIAGRVAAVAGRKDAAPAEISEALQFLERAAGYDMQNLAVPAAMLLLAHEAVFTIQGQARLVDIIEKQARLNPAAVMFAANRLLTESVRLEESVRRRLEKLTHTMLDNADADIRKGARDGLAQTVAHKLGIHDGKLLIKFARAVLRDVEDDGKAEPQSNQPSRRGDRPQNPGM